MASADNGGDSDAVYRQVRELIATRHLQPGDRLPSIRDLARRFGAGLVAVRDALVYAEREGLIEIRARSGAFVRSAGNGAPKPNLSLPRGDDFPLRVVDGQQLHLCHARELLEVDAAGQAAARCRPADLLPIREALEDLFRSRDAGDVAGALDADRRFHAAIAYMAGNPVIADTLDQWLRRQYMLECSLPETAADRRVVREIHNEIYEALRDRDAENARAAMRRHMKHLESNIHKLLLTPPGAEPASMKTAKKQSRSQA